MRNRLPVVLLIALFLAGAPARASNDELFSRQWGLSKIKAPQAWGTSRGAGVTIGVVDTGVDAGHPDLAGRVTSGRDFVNEDEDPQDDEGHGTQIAGIAVAVADNGIGVAGVAPESKVLAVKVLDSDGFGASGDIANGIRYVADKGAGVINLSLTELVPLDQLRSAAIDAAVRYAVDKGSVVAAAAGNDAYPFANRSTADLILLVGATTRDDTRASYSNSGEGVRIWAPGGDAVGGLFMCNSDTGIWSSILRGGGNCGYRDYVQNDGTSFAAPHVAGVAALVRSINPKLSPAEVNNVIIETSETISGGLKRVNAAGAVAKAKLTVPATSGGATAAGGGGSSGGTGPGGGKGSSTAAPKATGGVTGTSPNPTGGGAGVPTPGESNGDVSAGGEKGSDSNVLINLVIAGALVAAIVAAFVWGRIKGSRSSTG